MGQLGGLEKDRADFESAGAQLIAIAVQDEAGAAKSVEITKAQFPILADADHHVAELYGVFGGLDSTLATPAVFVIDKSGQVHWSHIAQNDTDRPSSQTILNNLPWPE